MLLLKLICEWGSNFWTCYMLFYTSKMISNPFLTLAKIIKKIRWAKQISQESWNKTKIYLNLYLERTCKWLERLVLPKTFEKVPFLPVSQIAHFWQYSNSVFPLHWSHSNVNCSQDFKILKELHLQECK